MDSLNLTTPAQHSYTDPTVERDVERLRAWLTNLPLMDVVETVRLVLGALNALNEQKLDDALRFRFLEVYRSTSLRLFQTVDPLHMRQLALSKSQRQEAIDGVARLLLDLAGGYKLIVKSCYGGQGRQATDALFGQALNRALELLSYALLDSYRFYREIPPVLMAESHVLYRVARHHGLLGITVETDDDAQAPLTTAQLYHASMLLSLTEPERLAEGEAGLLFDVLVQYAERCRIVPGNRWDGDGEGLFLIDLRTRALPVSCTLLKSPAHAQEPYLLDATRTLQAIRRQLEQTPEKVRMQSPEAMVLRRLLPERNTEQRHREQRHADGRYVGIIPGLEALHAWLRTRRDAAADDIAGLEQCRVLDGSANGMKLSWNEGGAGDARVGELVGIVEGEGSKSALQLALIRSIRVFREGGLEAGVLILAGGPGAVTCSVPDQPDQNAVHALFMPAVDAEQITATLIAAKGLYAQGRSLLIDVGGREIHVRAGRRVLDSPLFDRFEFSAL
jgi:hypothetical protein